MQFVGLTDASKMHPLFQALCLINCSGILPNLNKTADSDAVLAKSLVWLFLQEIKSGKNTTSLFLEKKHEQKDGHEGLPEGQMRWPHAAPVPGRVGPPQMGLGHRLASGLRRTPSYTRKNACPRRGELSRNTPPPPPRSPFWGQIDPGFVLRWRDPEAVFTAFIFIEHELFLHYHV